MISIYDRASLEAAPLHRLDPQLRDLLANRIAALKPALLEMTHFAIVEAGDSEEDIAAEVGFTPLVEPIVGIRFGEPGFEPFWAWLRQHPAGTFEMIHTVGDSGFAFVLLIPDHADTLPELLALCHAHADQEGKA